jgi:hypothetical protein
MKRSPILPIHPYSGLAVMAAKILRERQRSTGNQMNKSLGQYPNNEQFKYR